MAARAERLWVVAGAVAEALIGLLVHRDLPAMRSYLKVGLRPARTGGLWSVPLLGLTWSLSRRTGLDTADDSSPCGRRSVAGRRRRSRT